MVLEHVGELTPSASRVRAYDEHLDSITSILTDACEGLALSGQMRFIIDGFGQSRWPVDVETDLAVVMEQLPEVLHALRARMPTDLNFYEQGIGRFLVFTPQNDDVVVECSSATNWQPNPTHVRMSRAGVVRQLENLAREFVDQVTKRSPELSQHKWFLGWSKECGG
jgi:hypothetical protein